MLQGAKTLLPAPEITLPKIASDLAGVWSDLAARDVSGQLRLGHQDWTYRAVALQDPGTVLATVITLDLDGLAVDLAIDVDPFDWLAAADDYDEAYDQLAPGHLALVIEHMLGPEIAALEKAWNSRIALRHARFDVPIDTMGHLIGFAVECDGMSTPLRVFVDAADPGALADRIAANSPRHPDRDLRDLALPVAWLGPVARLRRSDLAAIAPGDSIFLAKDWQNPQDLAHLLVSEHHIVRAERADGGFRINGAEGHFDDILGRDRRQGANRGAKMQDDNNIGTLSDPSVVVTVELGRRDMTVSQIAALQTGAVAEFDIATPPDHVTLYADGKATAQGRLVQLDGTIGVQITKLV